MALSNHVDLDENNSGNKGGIGGHQKKYTIGVFVYHPGHGSSESFSDRIWCVGWNGDQFFFGWKNLSCEWTVMRFYTFSPAFSHSNGKNRLGLFKQFGFQIREATFELCGAKDTVLVTDV